MDHAEERVRRLFAIAAEGVPADIDLLHGVRIRRLRRRCTGIALAAASAAVVAAVLVTMLSGTAGVTPSRHRPATALTLVMTAATRTAAST